VQSGPAKAALGYASPNTAVVLAPGARELALMKVAKKRVRS
jgi:hypothetical protein